MNSQKPAAASLPFSGILIFSRSNILLKSIEEIFSEFKTTHDFNEIKDLLEGVNHLIIIDEMFSPLEEHYKLLEWELENIMKVQRIRLANLPLEEQVRHVDLCLNCLLNVKQAALLS